MNATETTILQRFRTLLAKRLRLHKLVLFGSRARGDAEEHSDMDVLVLVEGALDRETRDHISECAWEAGFEHGIVVVPTVFSRTGWEHGPERHSLLAQAILAEGVPV